MSGTMWKTGLMLGVLLLAGCAKPSDSGGADGEGDLGEADGPPTVISYESPSGKVETVTVAANKGILQGTVYTDAGSPLKGARVSILQTDFFADTDVEGAFQFVNVSLGEQQVSVVAAGFQGQVRIVEIRAAEATAVEFVLTLASGVVSDDVPHLHDYWLGKTEYVLIDHEFDFTEPDPDSFTPEPAQTITLTAAKPNPNGNTTDNWWRVPILDGDATGPAIIIPGTARLEFSMTWDPQDVTVADFGLAYSSPGKSGGPTVLGRQGTPATWSIDVNASMSDRGHQLWSRWNLYIYTTQITQRNPPDAYVMTGTIHITVKLYRGAVVDEPGHKDFWGANDTLILRDYATQSRMQGVCCQSRAGYESLRLAPPTIVPPGTNRMRIEMLMTYEGAAGPTPADLDYTLTWKTAAINPQTDTMLDWVQRTPTVDEKNHKVWDFAVNSSEADPFYLPSTLWEWKPWPRPFMEDGYWLESRTRLFQLGVQVWKDPNYGKPGG